MAKAQTSNRPDPARGTASQAKFDRDVLLARAKALARPAANLASRGEQGTLCLEFSIGRQAHAVNASYVLEVFVPGEITPVPGVPEFVPGVAPWRGEILPVVDLRTVCGLAEAPDTDDTGPNPVVVVGEEEAACGLIVTAVTGAARISLDDVAQVEGGADLFLLGLAPGDVIVIDVERLLQSERLVVREDESSLESI
jgi:chemotaxis signal transduction protein